MNLPRLNWLDRLISPGRLKYREKVHLLREFSSIDGSEYGDNYLVREAKKARQRGKDQQSLQAAKIGDIAIIHSKDQAWVWLDGLGSRIYINKIDTRLELQEIRHGGEKQRWESSMNILKCHIAHLEEIVARQAAELKRLR